MYVEWPLTCWGLTMGIAALGRRTGDRVTLGCCRLGLKYVVPPFICTESCKNKHHPINNKLTVNIHFSAPTRFIFISQLVPSHLVPLPTCTLQPCAPPTFLPSLLVPLSHCALPLCAPPTLCPSHLVPLPPCAPPTLISSHLEIDLF